MVKVLIPSGALGIGFDPDAFAAGCARQPDIIAIDGGSTDSGPHYLGTGTSKYSRSTVKAEWQLLMKAQAELQVPLLIGTAGTCGADAAVDWMLEITREIATEMGRVFRIAALYSGQDPTAIAANSLTPLAPKIPLTQDDLLSMTNVVALAGAEQIQAALASGADIVIAGRATDTAVIAALPLAKGCHPGACWHGAKIGECGALATTNPTSGSILIEFNQHGFVVEPMAKGAKATPRTVSAHMLYENADPHMLYEPGGYLDVSEAKYEALDDHRVRVTGSHWRPSDNYTVKLEGARHAGFQTVSMVQIRDAHYVANIEQWIESISSTCLPMIEQQTKGAYRVDFRLVGANATLGPLENKKPQSHEIAVLCLITAETQDLANEVAKLLNPYLLHHPLTKDEPLPTFAFPYSPPETPRGAIYEFALNHVMTLNEPMEAFRLEILDVGP